VKISKWQVFRKRHRARRHRFSYLQEEPYLLRVLSSAVSWSVVRQKLSDVSEEHYIQGPRLSYARKKEAASQDWICASHNGDYDMTPCSPAEVQRSLLNLLLEFASLVYSLTLKMETVLSSETSVKFCRTRRHVLENSTLQSPP
jgi:hypothetical protein